MASAVRRAGTSRGLATEAVNRRRGYHCRVRRLPLLLHALGAASALSAGAQVVPPPPSEEPAPEIPALLPTDGLLEGETWIRLGERLVDKATDALPSILAALLVLAVFLGLSRLGVRVLERVLRRARVDPGLEQIVVPLVRYSILILGVVMAASQAGFQVGSLLAGVGIAGLAIGLAAQDTLGSVFAGFGILWDRPFGIGDRVTIGSIYGQVTGIGLRSTRLRTPEELDVILPNREVLTATIVNHTQTPDLRLDVPLSIAYGEDTREARAVLLAAIEGHELVAESPRSEVVVVALADSGVELELRVWLADPHSENRAFVTMLELAKIALDEAGIEIPFPQRTLHLARGGEPLLVRLDGERAPTRLDAPDS